MIVIVIVMINKLTNLNFNEQVLIKGFQYIQPSLLALYPTFKHEEDFKGESDLVYTMLDLMYIHIYMSLIRLKYDELKSFEATDSFYNFKELKKCFACKNVDFDYLLELYEIVDNDTEEGISELEIDNTFRIGIEHINENLGSYNINELIENLNIKTCNLDLIGVRRAIEVDTNSGLSTDGINTLIEV